MQTKKLNGQDQILNDDELNAICGGDMKDVQKEAQMLQLLTTAVSNVIKNLGQALQGAARG